jgi:hypothetical protein
MTSAEKFTVDNNVSKALRAAYNTSGLSSGRLKTLDNDSNACVSSRNVGEKLDCNGKNTCRDKYLSTASPDALSGNDVDVANAAKHCAYVLYPNVRFILASAIFHSHVRTVPQASFNCASVLHSNAAPNGVFANSLTASHAPRRQSTSSSLINRRSALTAPGLRIISYIPRFVPAIRRTAAQNRRRRAAVVAAPLAAALAVILIVSHSLSFDRLSALTVTRDTPWRNGGSRALR